MSSSSNMADGYTKHELRAISRHNRRMNRSSYNKKTRSYKFANFVVNFWWLILLIIGIIAVVCIYLYMSASLYMESLVQQYDAVNEKVTNSKDNFTKTLFYASVNEDGKLVFTKKGEDIDSVDEDNEKEDDSGSEEGISVDVSELYQEVNPAKATNHTDISANVTLYNGWPWDATKKLVLVNFPAFHDKLVEDIASYLNISKEDVRHTEVLSFAEDWGCDEYDTVDGIICMGLVKHPIFVDTKFYENSWKNLGEKRDTPTTMYDHVALVLKDSNGKFKYLPVRFSDAKRHIWPGGVSQTFIGKTDGRGFEMANTLAQGSGNTYTKFGQSNLPQGYTYVDNTYGAGDGAIIKCKVKDALSLFDKNNDISLHYSTSGNISASTMASVQYGLEMNAANVSTMNSLKNSYEFVGIIVEGLK